jgi:histidyl-tRNA synthetase
MAAAGMSQEEQTLANQRLLDGDPAVIGEIEGRMPQLNAPLHLLFDVEGAGSGYLANVRGALSSAIPGLDAALGELAVIVQALEARGIAPILQAALARNFEYYSGIVFKIDTNGQRICTGGRYDELIGLVGGKRVPASGFGLYVAPIVQQLPPTEQSGATRVLVTSADDSPALLAAAQEVSARLRAAGLHVETIDGMETRAERRVVCAEGRCVLDGGSEFVTVEELLRALGAA